MNRILVALDGTPEAEVVLRYALSVATVTNARVRLVRAVPLPLAYPTPYVDPNGTLVQSMIDVARDDLEKARKTIPEAHRDAIEVVLGPPVSVIRDAAARWDAELVVIGAHAHGSLVHALGSRAARLTNLLPCAVVVVKGVEEEAHAAEPAPERAGGPEHTALETVALSGAVAGAVAGAMGGPPGILAGGVIGAAIGVLAGDQLENAATVRSRHDRAVDDAIGITAGTIGAGPIARDSLNALEAGASSEDAGENARAGAILRRDHTRLERIYDDLLEAYRAGDWNEVDRAWEVFEGGLRAHIAVEEEDVLPAFEKVSPEGAERIADDHRRLKALLGTLGVAIELHALPIGDAQALVGALRAHALREERILYPWVDVAIAASSLDGLAPAA